MNLNSGFFMFIFITLVLSMLFIYNNYSKEGFILEISNNCFFIVMEKYKERIKNINSIIKKTNLTRSQKFNAIDGEKLDRNNLLENGIISNKVDKKMKNGALGCAMSHITLWKKLVSSDKQYMIILEDDLTVDVQFREKLVNYIKFLPKDYDYSSLAVNPVIQYKSKFNKNLKINEYVKKGYPEYGTMAYIISKKGAKKLLKLCIPIYTTIDDMIANAVVKKKIISYKPIVPFASCRTDMISSICKDSNSCGGFI